MTAPSKLVLTLLGYALLLYLWILLPFNFYEPTRIFHLPALLWLIHLVVLYVHEAGHLLFGLFGETFHILGGSIMQVLVPLVWLLVARREESALAPVAAFFTGESIVDLSIYVRDAETKILPLIGGRHAKHDWATFLGNVGLLEWGVPLGNVLFFLGLILSIGAIGWGASLTYRRYQQARLEESQGSWGGDLPT